MRKFVSVQVAIGMLMIGAVAVNAAPANDPNQNQGASGQSTVSGQNAPDAQVQDRRIITPDMNARERVEMQRAIQKRAAAKRNSLIQAAEKEKIQQGNVESPGQPGAQ